MTNYTKNQNENYNQQSQEIENQNTRYTKYNKTQRNKHSSIGRIFVILFILTAGVLLSIFILADNQKFLENTFGKDSVITQIFIKLAQNRSNKQHAEFSLPFGMHRQNILLLGVDSNGADSDLWVGTRTDTMILLNIDPKTHSINAISIPRDSKVYLPDNAGIQKINAAHAIGGLKMTVKVVEDTLGVKVDYYIMVHDDAVKNIVDALGGVNIYVEKNMNYDDYAGKLHIHLTKGDNHLDGQEAVAYLRFRHDAMGDIGRTSRQQWFLRGLLKDLKRPETIAKIPDVLSVAKKYIKTDMSLYELSQYAALAKSIDFDKIEIAALPGAPNKKGYTSYWILDPEKTQEVVNRLVYRERVIPDKNLFEGSVLYSSEKEAEAKAIISEFETAGIPIKCTGNINRLHAQFIAHSPQVTNEYYNWLKKKVPEVEDTQFVYDPVNYPCGNTDFTLILSGK